MTNTIWKTKPTMSSKRGDIIIEWCCGEYSIGACLLDDHGKRYIAHDGMTTEVTDIKRWCYLDDLLKCQQELEEYKKAQGSYCFKPLDYEIACEYGTRFLEDNAKFKKENKSLKQALSIANEALAFYGNPKNYEEKEDLEDMDGNFVEIEVIYCDGGIIAREAQQKIKELGAV